MLGMGFDVFILASPPDVKIRSTLAAPQKIPKVIWEGEPLGEPKLGMGAEFRVRIVKCQNFSAVRKHCPPKLLAVRYSPLTIRYSPLAVRCRFGSTEPRPYIPTPYFCPRTNAE